MTAAAAFFRKNRLKSRLSQNLLPFSGLVRRREFYVFGQKCSEPWRTEVRGEVWFGYSKDGAPDLHGIVGLGLLNLEKDLFFSSSNYFQDFLVVFILLVCDDLEALAGLVRAWDFGFDGSFATVGLAISMPNTSASSESSSNLLAAGARFVLVRLTAASATSSLASTRRSLNSNSGS